MSSERVKRIIVVSSLILASWGIVLLAGYGGFAAYQNFRSEPEVTIDSQADLPILTIQMVGDSLRIATVLPPDSASAVILDAFARGTGNVISRAFFVVDSLTFVNNQYAAIIGRMQAEMEAGSAD